MNGESNVNREPPSHFADGRSPGRAIGNGHVPASAPKEAPQFGAADFLPFVDALGRHWQWLLIGGLAMAMVGLVCSLLLWKNSYTASAQLLRQASAHAMDVLGERELEPDTYAESAARAGNIAASRSASQPAASRRVVGQDTQHHCGAKQ